MKVLFYLGHPAHFHLFIHCIGHFGKDAIVVIKSKDILEDLLKEHGIGYHLVEDDSLNREKPGKIKLLLRMMKRSFRIYQIIRKYKPRFAAGSPAELAFTGKISGVPVYMFFEDDFEKVAPYGTLTGPFAAKLVCPDVCSTGKWSYKKTGYPSYHELAYLHPDHFNPDSKKVISLMKDGKKYFIIRFVQLGAFHDAGKTGITDKLANDIVEVLLPHGNVFITSERKLPPELEPYRISIPASDIHDALYFADMFIGDSQTMTAEAAVLGTPALRFNDFVGELSYLEDLEKTYGLTYGFKTSNSTALLTKIKELVQTPDLKQQWYLRREKMLEEKTNLAKWMIDFMEKQLHQK